jgi:serpin B
VDHKIEEEANRLNKIASANTQFGFKLFNELFKHNLEQNLEQNIFISPLSISIVLAIICNGADGETRDAICKTLELNQISMEEVNLAYQELQASLQRLDPQIQLALANALFIELGHNIVAEFLEINQKYYSATVDTIPERGEVINQWVKEKTSGKIKNIVENGPLLDYILLLLNAIYFKANWEIPFKKEFTKEDIFYLSSERQKKHPIMIHYDKRFRYYANADFQAINLPYADKRVSMYIFLPTENNSLEKFCQQLNQQNWELWLKGFHSTKIIVKLPRFKVEYEIILNKALENLGMGIAFGKEFGKQADFSKIFWGAPSITGVLHKSFIEVNEEGTEAAAVTLVMTTRMYIESILIEINRPFFYAIQDDETGTILFMGTVVDP